MNNGWPEEYAVIFTSQRTDAEMAIWLKSERMIELAQQQPGFLAGSGARGEWAASRFPIGVTAMPLPPGVTMPNIRS